MIIWRNASTPTVFSLGRTSMTNLCCGDGRRKVLRCLLCHGPVKYRHSPKIKPHFAHVARAVCEYREPETHEHVCGKEVIKQWVSSLFPANNTTVEACVSNGNQRADVLTVFPEGQQLCIEFQCSPVPLEVLRKRMKGYEENGIAQLWIIGKSRFRGKPLNRFRLHAWEDVIRQRHKPGYYAVPAVAMLLLPGRRISCR